MIPKDPVMLLSFINTQLRDNYDTLEELAASAMIDSKEVTQKLADIGYAYDAEQNRFVRV